MFSFNQFVFVCRFQSQFSINKQQTIAERIFFSDEIVEPILIETRARITTNYICRYPDICTVVCTAALYYCSAITLSYHYRRIYQHILDNWMKRISGCDPLIEDLFPETNFKIKPRDVLWYQRFIHHRRKLLLRQRWSYLP